MGEYKKSRWFQTNEYWTNLWHLGALLTAVVIRFGNMSGRGGSYTKYSGAEWLKCCLLQDPRCLVCKVSGNFHCLPHYCLDKAALVNLFSIFKASFFCQYHNFCLLGSSLAKTIRTICITIEVFWGFLTEPCVWEVNNIKISSDFTGVFTNFL